MREGPGFVGVSSTELGLDRLLNLRFLVVNGELPTFIRSTRRSSSLDSLRTRGLTDESKSLRTRERPSWHRHAPSLQPTRHDLLDQGICAQMALVGDLPATRTFLFIR